MNFKQILTAFFVFLLIPLSAHSQRRSGGGKGIGASIGAMVLFGQGKMGNSTDVQDRSMIYTPLAVFAGYNIKKMRLGLNYEYNIAGQSDDPAGFGNQNISGKGSATGLRIEYYNGRTSFGAIYHLDQKYTMDKPTVAGSTAEYEGKSGYGLQFTTQLKKRVGIVVEYQTGELKSVGGFTDDIKWNRIGLGLVFTNYSGGGGRFGR